MRTSRRLLAFQWMMYLVTTLQFLRVYLYSTKFYLRMPDYLSGRERLPFQERVLPVAFLDLFYKSPWVMHHLMTHAQGAFSRESGPFFFLSLVSLAACCYFMLKLYGAVTRDHSLSVVVYPFFLIAVMLTYGSHLEQNYSYPYDFAAIAFFTAGLYFIYTRRFGALLAVMVLGTLNRETTLFLIGIYMLDAATIEGVERLEPGNGRDEGPSPFPPVWRRLSVRQISWVRVAALAAVWIGIKLTVAYVFRHNDRSEDYPRLHENLGRLSLRLLPAMLNLCGYLLPVVWVMRNSIRPSRFGNYIYIFPLWLAVMFNTGIIVEVRIYGELCAYAVVACVLLLEDKSRVTPSERVDRVPEQKLA